MRVQVHEAPRSIFLMTNYPTDMATARHWQAIATELYAHTYDKTQAAAPSVALMRQLQ